MSVNPSHIVPVTLEGNFSKDALNCLIQSFAQNLNKGKISKDVYERVYLHYNAIHFGGEARDRRTQFDHEIQHLTTHDPKELEKKLKPVFEAMLRESGIAAGSLGYQNIVNFVGSLGFGVDVYLKPNLSRPLDFYTFLGIRRPNLPAGAPRLKIVCQGPMMNPRIEGFEYLVETPEDEDRVRNHKGIYSGRVAPRPLPPFKPKRDVETKTLADRETKSKAEADLEERVAATPRPSRRAAKLRPAPVALKKPSPPNEVINPVTSLESSITSTFNMMKQGINTIGQAFNLSQKTTDGLTQVVNGLFKFISQLFSKITPFFNNPIIGNFLGMLFGGNASAAQEANEQSSQEVNSSHTSANDDRLDTGLSDRFRRVQNALVDSSEPSDELDGMAMPSVTPSFDTSRMMPTPSIEPRIPTPSRSALLGR